ncbi:hypothetical protein BD769DRAFT_1670610 [Suillus cothurnatus]|nr:hypothetical protein BD769DRAFT_1670610 [Suillus cothurnatus]
MSNNYIDLLTYFGAHHKGIVLNKLVSQPSFPNIPKTYYHKNVQLSPKHPKGSELAEAIPPQKPSTPQHQHSNPFLHLQNEPQVSLESFPDESPTLGPSMNLSSIFGESIPPPFQLQPAKFFPNTPSIPIQTVPTSNITSAAPSQTLTKQNEKYPPHQVQTLILTVPNTPFPPKAPPVPPKP